MLEKPDRSALDERFVYTGARRQYLAFPLGGIGTGSVSLTGSGRLIDWSIRNRPAIHQFNGYSHFAIKAERDGKLLDARVLNGPYEGRADGFSELAQIRRIRLRRQSRFDGRRSPFRRRDIHRAISGRRARLSSRRISRPGADDGLQPVHPPQRPRFLDAGGALRFRDRKRHRRGDRLHDRRHARQLWLRQRRASLFRRLAISAPCISPPPTSTGPPPSAATSPSPPTAMASNMSITIFAVSGSTASASIGGSSHEPARSASAATKSRAPRATCFSSPSMARWRDASASRRARRATCAFAITWNYPIGSLYWFNRAQPGDPEYSGAAPTWRNYYATQWKNSATTGADAFQRWDALERETFAFRDSIFGSSYPGEIVDAATSTLAILRTATVIRLEGGELWGWEGQHIREGSCEGSCTHVWNYQQALSNLFPALERTLRETEFSYNQLPTGGLTFRQRLPLGSGFDIIGPCADGQFGAIVKAYREWKNSGDDSWLRRYWPNIKWAMQYAWSSENPDRWDPERTGVLWGRQHHTLDMELFGPNSWLTSLYLAALKAASRMAEAMGDGVFARECGELAAKGGAWVDENLFNGRYYTQKLALSDRSVLEPFDQGRKAGVLRDSFMEAYWSDEYRQIKYQIGEGCLTDQILGQWHADIAGLGDLLDKEKVSKALKSVFASNFRSSLRDHFNPCRVYAYEDEAGLLVCTWPNGAEKPAVPVPYAEEVWTGLEYMLASHLIQRGLVEEGLTIVRAARARHDGARRNPWNDIECGSYYARALSSYALVNAFLGLTFDQRKGEIGFHPAAAGDAVYFWSAGRGWGEIALPGLFGEAFGQGWRT